MNLIDFRRTPPAVAFDAVAREAGARGVAVHSSEVVGLIPLDALPENAAERLKLERFSKEQILEFKVFGESEPGLGGHMARVMGGPPTSTATSNSPTLEAFLSSLASGDPTPGGGAASALLGSIGASLALMGCRLTHGKTEFEASRARIDEIEARASDLQRALVNAIDEDVDAYNAVLDALRMPKATADEKAARSAALQKAFRWATEVPLAVAAKSCEVIELCEELARVGLQSAVSDVGVGGKAARAAVDGAAFNVLINLGSIKDEAFAKEAREKIEVARSRAARASASLDDHIRRALG
jgi:glutamate formiminotransferase/formiminotetrahydrofolate cyclodeaminase